MTTSERAVSWRSRTLRRVGAAVGLVSLVLLTTAGPAAADPPTNSSFENPDTPPGPTGFFAPSSFPGWNVVAGSVDIQGNQPVDPNQPVAADGTQFLDLNGAGPGVIQQSFPTSAGVGYVISWNYGDSYPCGGTKTGTFSVQGAAVVNMSVTGTPGDANWQSISTTFTGTGSPVLLQFAGTNSSVCGLAIDNIAIAIDASVPVVDPMVAGVALTLVAGGGGLYLLHRRRGQHELSGIVAR